MTYEEALKYIEGVSWLGSKPGLERIRELLLRLGNVHAGLRYVHVAGTNGKGSVSTLIASALTECGYRTALYTSPHLLRVNERMRIDGAEISDVAFAEVVDEIAAAAEGMEDKCTEFELITAAALTYFARERVDVAVLETGLGGRLDATNVIPAPDCAVITRIGLDHTEVLGDTESAIAREKAGIFKGGVAVSYAQTAEAASALMTAATETGTELTFADFSRVEPLSGDLKGQRFRFDGEEYSIRLPGEHQLCNAATALTALERLRSRGFALPYEGVCAGFESARWPARFELVSEKPIFVVDGGHNPQCVAATARAVEQYMPGGKAVILIGVLADKDYPEMLNLLEPVAVGFVTVTPNSERALSAEALAEELRRRGKSAVACGSVAEGVAWAKAMAGESGAVCSVGSLYMAGAVRECFGLR